MQEQIKSNLPKSGCLSKNIYYQVCFNYNCKSSPFMCDSNRCSCILSHQKCQIVKWQNLMQGMVKRTYRNTDQFKEISNKVEQCYKMAIREIENSYQDFKLAIQNFGLSQEQILFKTCIKQNKYNQLTSRIINQLMKSIKQPLKQITPLNKQQIDLEIKSFLFELQTLKIKFKDIYKNLQLSHNVSETKIVLKSLRGTVGVFRKKIPKTDNLKRGSSLNPPNFIEFVSKNTDILNNLLKTTTFKNLDDLQNQLWKIQRIDLSDNGINQQSAKVIAKCKNLTSLNLCDNKIGEIGALQIAKSLRNLTYLNLCNNLIGTKAIKQICCNLGKKLTFLDLQNNKVDDEAAKHFPSFLINVNELVLNENLISGSVAMQIAKKLTKLKWLQLQNNPIDDDSITQIKTILTGKTIYI